MGESKEEYKAALARRKWEELAAADEVATEKRKIEGKQSQTAEHDVQDIKSLLTVGFERLVEELNAKYECSPDENNPSSITVTLDSGKEFAVEPGFVSFDASMSDEELENSLKLLKEMGFNKFILPSSNGKEFNDKFAKIAQEVGGIDVQQQPKASNIKSKFGSFSSSLAPTPAQGQGNNDDDDSKQQSGPGPNPR